MAQGDVNTKALHVLVAIHHNKDLMDVLFILEHAAVHCNTSTLIDLRQVCLCMKQKTDIIIGISSHSSIGDELMTSIHDYE